ncbi:MAG: hypothetical protein WBO08_18780 [Mycobacterium sp.]|nr:hypothetical protein [Mycobacterium sp.]
MTTGTPTAERLQQLRNRREQLAQRAERELMEIRSSAREQLNEGETSEWPRCPLTCAGLMPTSPTMNATWGAHSSRRTSLTLAAVTRQRATPPVPVG